MLMISLSDRFLWLDRMHEAQGRLRQGVGDKPHLRNGSNIEMRNSALPERLQKLRRRIRLDRIKRFARKLFSKESSSPACSLRTNKRYRLNRARKSVVSGKGVSVRVYLGGRRIMKHKKKLRRNGRHRIQRRCDK